MEMFCHSCGAKIEGESRFCHNCGANIEMKKEPIHKKKQEEYDDYYSITPVKEKKYNKGRKVGIPLLISLILIASVGIITPIVFLSIYGSINYTHLGDLEFIFLVEFVSFFSLFK